MASPSSLHDDLWFVRLDGKKRGPYSLSNLQSMVQRARIKSNTEISSDGNQWIRASDNPQLFVPECNEVARPESNGRDDPNGEGLTDAQTIGKWYYSIDAVVAGPVSRAVVDALYREGKLLPSDYLLREGSNSWTPVKSIVEAASSLGSKSRVKFSRSSFHLTLAICASTLTLIALPTWYIVSLSNQRERERIAALNLKIKAEEAELQQQEEEEQRDREAAKAKLDQDNRDADRSLREREIASAERLEKTRIAEAARAEEQRNAILKELASSKNDQSKEFANSKNAQGKSSGTDDGSGKFKLGARVKNPTFLVLWTGTVVAVKDQIYTVRIDHSSGEFGSSKFVPGSEVRFRETELASAEGITSGAEILDFFK